MSSPAGPASPAMSAVLGELRSAAGSAPAAGASPAGWRWTLRQRLTAVRAALMAESGGSSDGWLAARGGSAFRERNVLLGRLADMGTQVLEQPDADVVRHEVERLVADISRHVQRLSDLAYDEVELELGGSE